jgi:tetratricopeptide (TPR) repeat protein
MRQMLIAGVAATMWFSPLSANQSSQPARDRAQEHLALVEQAYAARQGPEGETWRGRIQSTEPDLERSLDWLMQNGEGEQALRFADAMNVFWTVFGESQHSRERLTQALAMPSASAPTPLRAKALYDAGLLAFRQGDEAASRALNEESLAVARRLNNKPATATALIRLSRIALRNHDYAAVRRNADEALRVRQELGDVSGEMTAVHILAATARMEGDSAGASKFYELTLGIYGKDGNRSGVAGELMNLGYVHLHQHDPDWAFRLFKESVSIYRGLQSQEGLAWNIGGFAAVAAEHRDGAKAARLYGAVETAIQKLGIVLDPDDQLDFDRYSAMAREQVGATEFETIRAEGRRLLIDDALNLALAQR